MELLALREMKEGHFLSVAAWQKAGGSITMGAQMDGMILAESAGFLLEKLSGLAGSPWLIFLGLVLGTYGSEDLTCITGGLLAAQGVVDFPLAVAGCAVGIWSGDVVIYGLGALFSRGLLKWKWLARKMNPARIARGRALFERHGVKWIFLTRFMPGSRVISYLAAGATGWSLPKFASTLAVAAVVWTPLLCGAAYLAGDAVMGWLAAYERYALWILLGVAIAIWALVSLVLPMFTWRGRRKLYGKWLRLSRWEYWPAWVIYVPVGLYVLCLALRYRCLTLFTASIPAIPHSGFAMDEKDEILALFDKEFLPSHLLLTVSDKYAELLGWMEVSALEFPVVLKPNIGERGQGVAIIHDAEQAKTYLRECAEEVIAQEFIGGLEYGVYYQRMPDEERGRVFSLSCKHPQSLVGDGVQNIEQLILNDDRAVAMWRYFLSKFEDQLERVLAAGEQFPLAEIGTHARGAVFTDDRADITAALTEKIDTITRAGGEISCGRYDLRVPSVEDLRAGENLKLLEFNGVTAEPAHIYQPGYPLWRGIADLCAQWKFIYAAGEVNRKRGFSVTPLSEVRAILREHREKNWFEADDL